MTAQPRAARLGAAQKTRTTGQLRRSAVGAVTAAQLAIGGLAHYWRTTPETRMGGGLRTRRGVCNPGQCSRPRAEVTR